MTINQAITLAKKIMSNHPELKYWTVTTNNRKTAFGVCKYGPREIQLSALLVPAMTEDAIQDTIIHEIAHALCIGHNHDNVWKKKCVELGGNGQRCGGANKFKDGKVGQQVLLEKIAKYTLSCPCCNHKSYKTRKPTRSTSCGICAPRKYNEQFKMILSQNY